ncbi:hypothetical protein [Embleya sp. NPDC059259]|uniref:hypothetical protein n=1 Tax=unclassified Embleya TaxID=2699296 RepID=UPI0036C8A993
MEFGDPEPAQGIRVGAVSRYAVGGLTGERLRLRLFSAAQIVTTGRRTILRLARHWP